METKIPPPLVTLIFGLSIYFSREPIPTRSKCDNIPMKKQICIIPFKRKFLLEYSSPKEIEVSKNTTVELNNSITFAKFPISLYLYLYNSIQGSSGVPLQKKEKRNQRRVWPPC